MQVAILTMFTGLSTTYSLVNVVADQLKMLLRAGVTVQWVKITNTLHGQPIRWYDYSGAVGTVHDTFYEEADAIAADFVHYLQDVDVCILHDILYQGWHLVHNVALRRAKAQLPRLRFLAFTHSLPVNRPKHMEEPFTARFTDLLGTRYVYISTISVRISHFL